MCDKQSRIVKIAKICHQSTYNIVEINMYLRSIFFFLFLHGKLTPKMKYEYIMCNFMKCVYVHTDK